jgi:8-oxo-dGTP diphosphatase
MQKKDFSHNPIRSAGIVIVNHQLLVMFRKKAGVVYYTFPGGMVEAGETTQQAALREIHEETTIHVTCNKLAYQLNIMHETQTAPYLEYFYHCTYISGEAHLPKNSIEYIRMNPQNYYEPMWIDLTKLAEINLYPIEIRNQLITDLQHGFSITPRTLSIIKKEMLQN